MEHREGIFEIRWRTKRVTGHGLIMAILGGFGSSPKPILHSHYNRNPRATQVVGSSTQECSLPMFDQRILG